MNKKNNSIFGFNSDDVRSGSVELPVNADEHTDRPVRSVNAGRRWIYFLVVAIISAALSLILINGIIDRVNEGLVMELQTGDVVPSAHEDGLYSGRYTTAGMGAAVTVDITAGYIISISLDGFTGIDTARAQTVFNAVIAAQSLETGNDEIGSEPTDKILLLAIENALNGGGVQ